MPTTWLWCCMYAIPARISHPVVMCWNVSGPPLHTQPAPGILPGVVDLSFYQSCALSLISAPVLIKYRGTNQYFNISHFFYLPCRGLSFHDCSFLCSSSSFCICYLRYSLSHFHVHTFSCEQYENSPIKTEDGAILQDHMGEGRNT